MDALYQQYSDTIREAAERHTPLCIRGSGSKDFYGRIAPGQILDTRALTGIVSYEPTELVLTARAGTPLQEIEAALAAKGQMLPFEPPHFGPAATLGGAIAAGLSGPRRPWAGSARDFVLGVRMIDGKGDILHFGGEVMKNVAGYDVSRLMTGSLGTLGLLLEVSLKVLPRPAEEITLRFRMNEQDALTAVNQWSARPLSLSATAWVNGELTARLSGAAAAVRSVREKIGGDAVVNGDAFWRSIREQEHAFFQTNLPLWRLSLPATTPALDIASPQLIEWGGSLRWLTSTAAADSIRLLASQAGGHATLFHPNGTVAEPFQALSKPLVEMHRRLKNTFDPHSIFNPGRMYEGI